jgi:hypothetical protein
MQSLHLLFVPISSHSHLILGSFSNHFNSFPTEILCTSLVISLNIIWFMLYVFDQYPGYTHLKSRPEFPRAFFGGVELLHAKAKRVRHSMRGRFPFLWHHTQCSLIIPIFAPALRYLELMTDRRTNKQKASKQTNKQTNKHNDWQPNQQTNKQTN